MKWHALVRIVAIVAIVVTFYIYSLGHIDLHPFLLAIAAIVALVSPEAIDRLPLGPSK